MYARPRLVIDIMLGRGLILFHQLYRLSKAQHWTPVRRCASRKSRPGRLTSSQLPRIRFWCFDPFADLERAGSNSYFLTKKGCNNPKCNYSHSYKLSAVQLEEMRCVSPSLPVFGKNILTQDGTWRAAPERQSRSACIASPGSRAAAAKNASSAMSARRASGASRAGGASSLRICTSRHMRNACARRATGTYTLSANRACLFDACCC